MVLKPLPYPEPDRLVMAFEKPPDGSTDPVSAANFLDWRESSRTIALVASGGNWLTMTGNGEPRRADSRPARRADRPGGSVAGGVG